MQIVININNEYVLADIRDKTFEPQSETDRIIIEALYNGTPLPKGHGRLIDADAVEKEMNKAEVEADRNADYYTSDKIDCAMEYIIGAETIIEADKEGD